jgi:uncharacterized protein (TIRG00374 family)
MKLKILFSLIILGVLFYIISHAINLEQIPSLISSFPKSLLLLLVGLSFMISVLKAWRFLIVIRNNGVDISFWQNLKAFLASQAITPLPGGETSRTVLLHFETGTPKVKAGGSVITQAYIEVFTATFTILFLGLFYKLFIIPTMVIFIVLIFLALLLTHHKTTQTIFNLLPRWKRFKNSKKHLLKLQQYTRENFYDQKSGLLDKVFVRSFILSGLADLVGGLLIFLIAQYYQVDLSFFKALFVYCASIVISALAIFSPGGLGFTEGGTTGLLLLFGIDLEKAIAIILVFRLTTLIFYIFLGLIILVIFYSKDLLLEGKLYGQR